MLFRRDRKGGPIRNRKGGSGFGPAAVWKEKFQSVLAEKNKVRLSSKSRNDSHDGPTTIFQVSEEEGLQSLLAGLTVM